MLKKTCLTLATLGLSVAPAFAHLDPGQHGSFLAGVSHPLSGADHMLAMVAVGLWAALLAGRPGRRPALWLVPSAFVVAMALGFLAALLGLPLPLAEPTILASVVVIGLVAAVALDVPSGVAMAMVGFFAVFHGHAHGGELGVAGALPYGAGFALSTAALHGAGLALGLGLGRVLGSGAGRATARLAGGATALGGLWLAFGA